MELKYQELEYKIRLIKLIGKLDIGELRSVESEFIVHCAGKQVKVIVDLSEVNEITTSGAKLLLWTAKEVVSRGGKYVLLNPKYTTLQLLERNGINEWASIHSDFDTTVSLLLDTDTTHIKSL